MRDRKVTNSLSSAIQEFAVYRPHHKNFAYCIRHTVSVTTDMHLSTANCNFWGNA